MNNFKSVLGQNNQTYNRTLGMKTTKTIRKIKKRNCTMQNVIGDDSVFVKRGINMYKLSE